jgi:hypothetical protein
MYQYMQRLLGNIVQRSLQRNQRPPHYSCYGKIIRFYDGKVNACKVWRSREPNLTVQINGVEIPNVLVDLGAAINVITTETMHALGLRNLKHTPTVLELADRSTVKPVGKLEDVTISVDSWHYPIDFLVLHTQSSVGGHPLILGRPWLATADAYIGCRSGHMVISNGHNTKNLVLYPPAEPNPSIKPAGARKFYLGKSLKRKMRN